MNKRLTLPAFAIGILLLGQSAFGTLSSGLSIGDRSSVGNQLSSAAWNRLVDAVMELDARTSGLSSSGGNVGIGTANPSAKFEVAGSVKFGGRQISKITVCSFSGTPNSTLTNRFYHYWTGSECDNGLPSGTCLGFLTKAWHSGSDQDWEVVFPGEAPVSAGGAATNGGMAWWTASSGAGLGIQATYMCQ